LIIDTHIESFEERRIIEDNKLYARQSEKTQVLVPQLGRDEVTKNRATHSYEVSTSSLMIAASLAKYHDLNMNDIDHQLSLYNVSLLHDIGHPPFGHDGADLLDKLFKSLGLTEGFSDNNNNLVAIRKNKIKIRDYTLASIIKYPESLYPDQKTNYLNILQSAIELDIVHFSKLLGFKFKGMKTTIACQVMDEADRNSYTFSDMSDFLCIGNKITKKDALEVASKFPFSETGKKMVSDFVRVSLSGNKSLIKAHLSDIKERVNKGYKFNKNGLKHSDTDLITFREFINKLTKLFYIRPIRKLPFHLGNMDKFNFVMGHVLDGSFIPSKHYKHEIKKANSEDNKLRAMRDMISETSDWYILTQYEKLLQADINKKIS
jgi:dGTP triphosphohydrolase